MDKEALELQREWTEGKIKRINEETERFMQQRKKLDKIIEDNEREIIQLQESLKKNTEEYLSDKPYEAIQHFIKERGYTYSVDDIIEGFRKRKHRFYNSYTMNDCIDNLTNPLELISNKV